MPASDRQHWHAQLALWFSRAAVADRRVGGSMILRIYTLLSVPIATFTMVTNLQITYTVYNLLTVTHQWVTYWARAF